MDVTLSQNVLPYQEMPSSKKIHDFQKIVRDFYKKNGRHNLPWRKTKDPYKILVSEIMLQQTQVDRVIPKYKAWLEVFPTTKALASASKREVLLRWKGLGYNNRALRLQKTAQIIEKEFCGKFPKEYKTLLSLPGIGPATAGDLLAFAWNIPIPIIETNLRTVFIHHFFPKKQEVSDREILHLIERTLPSHTPKPLLRKGRANISPICSSREWYWALMDYGSHLKRSGKDKNTQSKHYKKQSTFKGSNRELRSKILSVILERGPLKETDVHRHISTSLPASKEAIQKNLETMTKEGIFKKTPKGFEV